ncbi:gamma-glutamyltranspeptidase [Mycolicibacterium madagascariense]|uniref:Gamma-glutamyltranspeptidase n=1 Tax=Mycolicibacterium madagascariense TaxID=212765 RepID=A0A7I7XCH6_9MYCO|nr:gamma-glutamyltransferase [Mycolicibacterium madagascariense]MCV7013586.1 gamma-glutamyltransferase [Mycolicibacterium madagascariense]BBZ27035.1 gamma-glutamyltranspeptidase [Mycolicibacterium madagascariense]
MTTSTAALATPHALATEAGLQAYRDGGNAIDAAITAAAVLTVVYPHNVALGGDLIALIRTPDGAVRCLNASGWAGAAVDAAGLRARHGDRLPARGAHAVTVPGGVRGWETLRTLGSRLSWADTLRAAEEVARAGAPVAPSLAAHLADAENAELFAAADFAGVFRPGGRVLRAGDPLVQTRLADTFAALRHRGGDDFYDGELAEQMVSYLRAAGSVLTVDDFAAFRPETVDPLAVDFADLTVHTSPPSTHGFILSRALRAIVALGLDDPLGGDLPALLRTFEGGNVLREHVLADPRLAEVDVEALVSAGLEDVSEGVTRAATSVPRGDTVGVAAADGDGFAVSLIQSVFYAFGSGLVDPATGVLFHNRGTSFSLDPMSPNVIAPHKRPVHTLMPVMTTHAGEVRHVLATMGGQGQPQILGQVLLRAVDGATADAAVGAPRAIVGTQVDGATVDSVTVERDLADVAMAALADAGVEPIVVPPHTDDMGHTNVVFIDQAGTMTAASDPRSDGAAAVVDYVRRGTP